MAAATAHSAAPPPLPPVPARAGGLYLVIPEELTGLFPGGLRGLFPSQDDAGPAGAAALADGWPQEWPGEPEQSDDGQSAAGPIRPEVFKAGRWDRSRGDGPGFGSGGVADRLPPGVTLAGLAGDAWDRGLDRVSDDELIGVMRAARRLASWAAAMELAAVADLWRRRLAEDEAGEAGAAAGTGDEIAAALTLTGRSADKLLDLAVALDRLPATSAALAAGDIDLPRA